MVGGADAGIELDLVSLIDALFGKLGAIRTNRESMGEYTANLAASALMGESSQTFEVDAVGSVWCGRNLARLTFRTAAGASPHAPPRSRMHIIPRQSLGR
jgi:hypothetical protein